MQPLYIRLMPKTSVILDSRIFPGGMGMASSSSLSLAMYKVEKVLNTLPKVPNRMESTPISA